MLIKETITAHPPSNAEAMVTLEIDGETVTVPAGTSVMRAAAEMGTKVPKLCATDSLERLRLLPPVPGGDRGPQGHAGLLHHAGRSRHEGADPDPAPRQAAPRRDGALHLRPSAGLPDLRRQRRLRAAGHGGRSRPARSALRLRRREPPEVREGQVQPLFHLRSGQVHRLLALRARLRGGAGHLRADHRRARLRLASCRPGRTRTSSIPNASPAAPACRPARPRR